MFNPITVELLSRSHECDRVKQREACQLRNSAKTSGASSRSQIQRGMDRLQTLLLHAGKRLSQAKTAFRAQMRETNG